MKKIFIVLLLFFFSLEFVKGQTSKLGYEVSDSAGVLELVKWERKDSIVDLTKEDNLKQVKAIGNCCFVFNDYIKTVILPEGVEIIKGRAFDTCKNLHHIYLPNSLRIIGQNSFNMCENLRLDSLPPNLKRIEYGAFWDCCRITISKIPNTVTYIGGEAFTLCESMQELVLPDSIIEVKERTFAGCKGLKKIKLPNSLQTIEKYAFARCIYNHRTTKTNQKYPSVNL